MSDVDFSVGVILPASGCGERMRLSKPKQFCEVAGRPLILFSISIFHRLPWIKYIIVTASDEHKEDLEELVCEYKLDKVLVVSGSSTRHRSIYNGIKAVKTVCPDPEVVLIQDAVRIFAEEDLIKKISTNAHKHGACGVSRPLVSTVIAADSDGMLSESLDRNQYVASEMPQGFLYHVIREAYDKSTDFDFDYGTECLLLAKKHCGVNAHIVQGKPYLWKVTHRKDLYSADMMLKEYFMKVMIDSTKETSQFASCIETKLLKTLEPSQVRNQISFSAGDEDFSWNTLIRFHTLVPDDVEQLNLSLQDKHHHEDWLFDLCLVHVFVLNTRDEVELCYSKLCFNFNRLMKKWRKNGVLLYGVLTQRTESMEDICSLLEDLMGKRTSSFSGQVFLV